MEQLYYSSENGTPSGRASALYRDEQKALDKVEQQNAQAELLGLKVRYAPVCSPSTSFSDTELKEIR